MEELKPDVAGTEEPKPAGSKAEPRGPIHIVPPPRRSALEKTVGVLRAILPVAQKVLPLIDGQIGTAVSNLIGPQVSPRQVTQTLLPLQEGLAQLEKRHIELRAQLGGQDAALRQLEEQLNSVRKLAEETAEKQSKLAEGLGKMSRWVKVLAIIGFVLLAAVAVMNAVFFVHLRQIGR